MSDDIDHDEFALLEQYATHNGIPWRGRPAVVRQSFETEPGRRVSALVWGTGEPEAVLMHGGGQNAHTWDSVALALDIPLIALDLPGHGHSDWFDDHDYGPWPMADAVAPVIERAAPNAKVIVGMSLGGQTNIRLAAKYRALVRRAVVVDTTPGSTMRRFAALTPQQRGATVLVEGQMVFDTFDDMLRATASAVPGRPIESLRAGVGHNARRLPDGRWGWRYDPERAPDGGSPADRSLMWDDLAAIEAPILLVPAGASGRIEADDLAEFRRRQPTTRVEVVEGSGHSVQSDRPVQLARLISDFVAST